MENCLLGTSFSLEWLPKVIRYCTQKQNNGEANAKKKLEMPFFLLTMDLCTLHYVYVTCACGIFFSPSENIVFQGSFNFFFQPFVIIVVYTILIL